MDIEKLKDYLRNTPLEELQKEWEEVEKITKDMPKVKAEDLIKDMKQKYKQKQKQ